LSEALRLATEVNRYLDVRAPWSEIKVDRAAAAKTVYTALRAIDSLKILFAPFVPFSSEKLHSYFGYTYPLFGEQKITAYEEPSGPHEALTYVPTNATGKWQPSQLKPHQVLRKPEPLFKKLEESVAEEEVARLHGKA